MVKADIKVKYYLHNSISDDIKVKINFTHLIHFK